MLITKISLRVPIITNYGLTIDVVLRAVLDCEHGLYSIIINYNTYGGMAWEIY